MLKGGIFVGGYGQKLQETNYQFWFWDSVGIKRQNCHALSVWVMMACL
jgi:hypothetical protein